MEVPMHSKRLLILAVCGSLLLAACGSDDSSGDSDGSSSAPAVELTVFAASSLTDAFTQIGSDFEAANTDTTVTFNFGSSGDLAASIESEGTADVFASASGTYMDEVSHKVRVTGRADFVQNKLVIITPPDNPAGITSIEDLGNPGVQVVLAAEGVPVGDYAREALENAGVTDAVMANLGRRQGHRRRSRCGDRLRVRRDELGRPRCGCRGDPG
jgi:molybdate transport system substrate-binding protein